MAEKLGVGIEVIAYSLGKETLTNDRLQIENPQWDMAKTLERTGVVSRPIAPAGTTALDMAYEASLEALERLQLSPADIDALIFCTQTPDHILPPNSTILHGRLGMPSTVMAFDITHACSGFVYAVGIARSLVLSGAAHRVLVITADTYSRLVHSLDRSVRPLFGDGAAATIVSAHSPALTILDMSFGTSGRQADRFIVKNGGSRFPITAVSDVVVVPDKSGRIHSENNIYMDGMGVLSFFTGVVPVAVREILAKQGKALDDVSLFVFHQASQLALEGIARSLKISPNKMVIDMTYTGNLVSASIPVALSKCMSSGTLTKGQLIVLCGFGVGLSWATALLQL